MAFASCQAEGSFIKEDYLPSCEWNLGTTRDSRVPRMVITELFPALKPRKGSLVDGAALTGVVTFNRKHSPCTLFKAEAQNTDHILLPSHHLSGFPVDLIQLEVRSKGASYCVIQMGQFSGQRIALERGEGQTWKCRQISS